MKKGLYLLLPLFLAACNLPQSDSSTKEMSEQALLENIELYRSANLNGNMAFSVGKACELEGVEGGMDYVRYQTRRIIDSRSEIDAKTAAELSQMLEDSFVSMNNHPEVYGAFQNVRRSIHKTPKGEARLTLCRETINYYLRAFNDDVRKLH